MRLMLSERMARPFELDAHVGLAELEALDRDLPAA